MGISLLTALIIQNNEVGIYPFQSGNKWGYEVACFERENYRQLVTCEPFYETEQKATEEGEKFVAKIKTMDLSEKSKGLKQVMGEEESKIVGDIVAAAK